MMYELLARDTKMEIHRSKMECRGSESHLPAAAAEGVDHRRRRAAPADKDINKGLTLPIDRFFESLARECGPRAIGLISVGSGSDGSRGIRDIAQAGGLVICESEETPSSMECR